MARVYLLLVLIDVALAAYCLIDCIVTPGREIRALSKPIWLLLLLVLWPFAWVAWLTSGRPASEASTRRRTSGSGRSVPLAPDDDPDFLRGLSTRGFRPRDGDPEDPEKPQQTERP